MDESIEGTLTDYSEQGWEAHFELCLAEDGKPGHPGLHTLAPGDQLTVWNTDGSVLFEGPLPAWDVKYVLVFFRVDPTLPEGFFDWFRTHHYRARLTRRATAKP